MTSKYIRNIYLFNCQAMALASMLVVAGNLVPAIKRTISKKSFTYLSKEMNMSMNYENRDTYGMYKSNPGKGAGPNLMGANTLIGNDVYNQKNEELGGIKEIMLDTRNGKVCYAVLTFGGFLGLGEKLFAVPWNALTLDTVNKRFVLNVEKESLKTAPGFNKNDWPDMADETWNKGIHSYYGTTHGDATDGE